MIALPESFISYDHDYLLKKWLMSLRKSMVWNVLPRSTTINGKQTCISI